MKQRFALSLLCALGFVLMSLSEARAQDPQYTQYYSNQLMLNPAFAGSSKGPRIAMNYRSQWVKIPGFYVQGAFSYDQPFYVGNTRQGYGININYDRAGEGNLTKIDISGNYSFEVPLTDEHTLRLGVAGGFQQASIDFFRLRFPDQIDPRDGVVRPTAEPGALGGLSEVQYRPDFSAGFLYYNSIAFLGLTVNHLTEPVQRFYNTGTALPPEIDARLPRKYTVSGGLRLPMGPYNDPEKVVITPTFLFKQQGQFNQIDAGLYIDVEPMTFGFWYRNQDAVIGLIGVRQGPLSFAYSYDYTISTLGQINSGGSHELSVTLEFEQDRAPSRFKHKDPPCPKF